MHYRKFNQLYKYLVKSIELAVDGFDLKIFIYIYIYIYKWIFRK